MAAPLGIVQFVSEDADTTTLRPVRVGTVTPELPRVTLPGQVPVSLV